jgi:acylphosphatase
VRNVADGAVDAEAEGPEERLRRLEAALRKGPPGSRVEWVDAAYSPADGSFTGFQVRY